MDLDFYNVIAGIIGFSLGSILSNIFRKPSNEPVMGDRIADSNTIVVDSGVSPKDINTIRGDYKDFEPDDLVHLTYNEPNEALRDLLDVIDQDLVSPIMTNIDYYTLEDDHESFINDYKDTKGRILANARITHIQGFISDEELGDIEERINSIINVAIEFYADRNNRANRNYVK